MYKYGVPKALTQQILCLQLFCLFLAVRFLETQICLLFVIWRFPWPGCRTLRIEPFLGQTLVSKTDDKAKDSMLGNSPLYMSHFVSNI